MKTQFIFPSYDIIYKKLSNPQTKTQDQPLLSKNDALYMRIAQTFADRAFSRHEIRKEICQIIDNSYNSRLIPCLPIVIDSALLTPVINCAIVKKIR